MSIKVQISPKNLSANQLVKIFHLFCKAYDIEPKEYDDRYLRNQGIQKVNSGSTLDYRPFMGATKFFVVGIGEHIEVWGYASDNPQPKEREEFRKSITDYLGEKPFR